VSQKVQPPGEPPVHEQHERSEQAQYYNGGKEEGFPVHHGGASLTGECVTTSRKPVVIPTISFAPLAMREAAVVAALQHRSVSIPFLHFSASLEGLPVQQEKLTRSVSSIERAAYHETGHDGRSSDGTACSCRIARRARHTHKAINCTKKPTPISNMPMRARHA
jgi:hypothetical protein